MTPQQDTTIVFSGANSSLQGLILIDGYHFQVVGKDTIHVCVWPTCGDYYCAYLNKEDIAATSTFSGGVKQIAPVRFADTLNMTPYFMPRPDLARTYEAPLTNKALEAYLIERANKDTINYNGLVSAVCFSILLFMTAKYIVDSYEHWRALICSAKKILFSQTSSSKNS